jgi:geranylgeranyl diphosphate synthase type I
VRTTTALDPVEAPSGGAADDEIRRRTDAQLAVIVDDALVDFVAAVAPRLAELDSFMIGPHLSTFLTSRGKRIRPIYTFYGAALAGARTIDPVLVSVATALELFHAFALIHDDVMDDSMTRRGEPTLYRRYVMEAERAGDSDPRAMGRNLAVLAGDLVLCWAENLFRDGVWGTPNGSAALGLFSEMKTETMVGQALDVCYEKRVDHITPVLTSRIIEYKTSRYTFLRPIQIGAVLGGASDAVLTQCAQVAIPLGRAFQLRDDLLGAFGDSTVIGKSGSADLESGKATELLRRATEYAPEGEVDFLRRHLGRGRLAPPDLARARRILLDTGAYAGVLSEMARSVKEATRALRRSGWPQWLSQRITCHLDAMSDLSAFVTSTASPSTGKEGVSA